jgi:hypothetical protein
VLKELKGISNHLVCAIQVCTLNNKYIRIIRLIIFNNLQKIKGPIFRI